jgi:hypothetical protein
VRAGPGEQQLAAFSQVNQNPVWLDVAVPIPLPLAAERMVLVSRLQGPVMTQLFDDRLELGHVLAAFLLALHVPLELGGRDCYERRRG